MTCENGRHQKLWEQRFVETALNPFSDTRLWVELGVRRGLTTSGEQGRLTLAREMGAVMAIVLSPNGRELTLEELGVDEMATTLGQDPARIAALVNLMVDAGVIISQQRRRELRSKNGRGW